MLTLLLTLTIQAAPADLRMPLAEFKKLYAAGNVLVVDVRGEQPYQQGHIPGAIWIPTSAVAGKLAELKSEKRAIVTYCSWPAEATSARAALAMRDAGLDAWALLGGYDAWIKNGGKAATGPKPWPVI